MDKDGIGGWGKVLNPKLLKQNLIQCSLFLTGYEALKNTVLSRLQSFYSDDWNIDKETGEFSPIISDEYKEKVLSLYPKDQFQAGCLWFRNSGAIDDQELEKIKQIRKHRNYIAHEIIRVIVGDNLNVNEDLINQVQSIVQKLEFWWIKEVETQINPDLDNIDIDTLNLSDTFGGHTMLLSLVLSIFNGDESYLNEVQKYFD